jgi:Icc protein
LSEESLGFLDDALARFADSHVLVVLHHHPVPVGSAWLDSIRLMNGPELLQAVARHRNVRGMLWGHVHQSFDGMHDGVAMMSTPSTCFQFVPGRDDFAIDERPPGYRWLHLYPDGRIDTRVVWVPAE